MKAAVKKIILTIASLLMVVRYSRFVNKFPKSPLERDTCFVLGNGPSLNADLEKYNDFSCMGDVWCVNQFGESQLYEIIKPKHYVFADPSYWGEVESAKLIEMRNQIFESLIKKTNWPLSIYAPFQAKNYFNQIFQSATNIRLIFYNNVPVRGHKKVVEFFYKHGLGMPMVQNVLVAALFLSIHRGYKKIILLGADHSWHQTLQLDDSNRVCYQDRHFYETEAKLVPFTMGGHEQETFTMPQLFFAFANMFEGYWKIKEYSKFVGAEIYNASSVTYIDAFKRIKFTESLECNLRSDRLREAGN